MYKVKYHAGKIVCGAIAHTSHDLVNKETGWVSLSDRRKKHRLKVFYKMTSGEAPVYLCNSIPVKEPGHNYNLRNEDQIPHIRGRTVFYDNTFIPKTIRDWNELPSNVRNADSSESFSNNIGKKVKQPPAWYYSGERWASIMHAHIRMLCSPLKDLLYSHIHVVDSLYINERGILIEELRQRGFNHIVKSLLYGNECYSEEVNCQAFKIIQNFIMSTGRFGQNS